VADLFGVHPALEEHNTAANHQSAQYKKDVKQLVDDPQLLILVLDFTKFHQVVLTFGFFQ